MAKRQTRIDYICRRVVKWDITLHQIPVDINPQVVSKLPDVIINFVYFGLQRAKTHAGKLRLEKPAHGDKPAGEINLLVVSEDEKRTRGVDVGAIRADVDPLAAGSKVCLLTCLQLMTEHEKDEHNGMLCYRERINLAAYVAAGLGLGEKELAALNERVLHFRRLYDEKNRR